MIDPAKLAQVKVAVAGGEPVQDPLRSLSDADLRRLRREINVLVPEATLGTMNLESELIEQYNKTKDLMDDVLHDEGCPANQKAQVANSVVSTLAQLVKLQEDLKRQETLKVMEAVLIDVVKTFEEPEKEKFYADYERLAGKAGLL